MSWPHQILIQKTLQFHVFLAPNHNSHCTWNVGGRNRRHNGPNRYMREILTNLIAVQFFLTVNLCRGPGQFEYTVVVSHEKCFVWTVCSSAANVFPRCRDSLASRRVVTGHYTLWDFCQVPSRYKAVIFICCQANIR